MLKLGSRSMYVSTVSICVTASPCSLKYARQNTEEKNIKKNMFSHLNSPPVWWAVISYSNTGMTEVSAVSSIPAVKEN